MAADVDPQSALLLLMLAMRLQFDRTIETKSDCVRYLMNLSKTGEA